MGITPALSRDLLIADLRAVWGSIAELCADLSHSEWNRQTRCPGWSVRDVLSHMIGTELMLAGKSDPSTEVGDASHIKNDIGRFNEVAVERRRDHAGADVLAEFTDVTAHRLDELGAMDDEAFDADAWTPAGQSTYGRFMQIRVFDCWMHELDIRAALGRPGGMQRGVVERGLAEMKTALGFAVGKKAGAPDGSSVAFHITGPVTQRIDVVVDGRAAVVDAEVPDPTATVTCDVGDFAALCGGRVDAAALVASGDVVLGGDLELAERVVTHMAFVI